MHPGYLQTRFRTAPGRVDWPGQFAIITGYATTGESWPEHRNEEADAALQAVLSLESPWLLRVTGCDPDTGHAEPGWAAAISLQRACELGVEFLQDAVFHVVGDVLSVVRCQEPNDALQLGSFGARVDPREAR